MVYSVRTLVLPLCLFPCLVAARVVPVFSIASLSIGNHMAEETPQNQKQTTLAGILEDLNQVGFKITGKLKALILSGEEHGLLRVRDRGDPLYDATCLGCGTVYEERLGGMLLACTACVPLVAHYFPTAGDWTREVFITLCRAIVEAGHLELPAEDTMRSCRFCGRGTTLWIGTQFAAPDFCHLCVDTRQAWNAQAYLRLLERCER